MADCPRPDKVPYQSWEQAQWAVADIRSTDETATSLRPYRCLCGRLHIGNPHTLEVGALLSRLFKKEPHD